MAWQAVQPLTAGGFGGSSLWHPVMSTTASQSSGQADVQIKFGKITDKVRGNIQHIEIL
jgi:hypothetical protein